MATPNTDVETEKPSRAGSFGDGGYQGTDGYAKSATSYPSTANDGKNAAAASEGLQKIADLAADIGVAMVTTLDVSSQTLTSRPMMSLEMDEKASLWFSPATPLVMVWRLIGSMCPSPNRRMLRT